MYANRELSANENAFLTSYHFKYPKFHDCGKFKYEKLLEDIFTIDPKNQSSNGE